MDAVMNAVTNGVMRFPVDVAPNVRIPACQERVTVIGVPFCLGAGYRGIEEGPRALRRHGLIQRLRSLDLLVTDIGDISPPAHRHMSRPTPGLNNRDDVLAVCKLLCGRVADSFMRERFTLVLGGDHSIAWGTSAGLSRVCRQVGLLWVDAHGDFNTDRTTLTGNIHGMSLALSVGRGPRSLLEAIGSTSRIREENCVLVGVRDLDPQERTLLRDSGVTAFTIDDIAERGMSQVMTEALAITCAGTDAVHVSFDLDVIDPSEAPGVSTPVRGGISYREARLVMRRIGACAKVRSLDVVELNPLLDQSGATQSLAIALVETALGGGIT